jgi:hypothetical protein
MKFLFFSIKLIVKKKIQKIILSTRNTSMVFPKRGNPHPSGPEWAIPTGIRWQMQIDIPSWLPVKV